MFGPGVPFYLSFFYPPESIGTRHGIFISGAAIANAYGGALGYALSHIEGSIAPWKILFIIEGIPTCLLAFGVWYYLPDSLSSATFLNDREKAIAKQCLARNQKVDFEGRGIRFLELFEAFKDPTSE